MRLIKNIKNMGKDTNGKIVAIFDIICDTESDLPAANQYSNDGLMICQGSRAWVIGSATRYMMQSGGTWTIQNASTAAYTKAETDALISAAISDAVTQAAAQIIPAVYGLGTQIPNNSDFDDYTIPGVYYVGSNAAAATMSNIPAANGGRLEVKATISAAYFVQEYTTNATPVEKYIRRKLSTGYTTWQAVTFT